MLKWLVFIFGCLLAGSSYAVTILCLGDSLTEGYGVAKESAWPAVAEKILRDQNYKVTLINAGISGSTTASGLSRLNWHLKSTVKADWLVLALGANDGLRGQDVKAAKQNLEKTIDAARAAGIKKVILAGIKAPPSIGPSYVREFDALFPKLAQAKKTIFYPFLLEGVAAVPKYNLPDGIHPNAEGHKIIGEKMARFLKDQL